MTLDHGGGGAELRRPPSAGQTPRAAADHQEVEPGHVRGHASAGGPVSAGRREERLCAVEAAGEAAEELRPARLG